MLALLLVTCSSPTPQVSPAPPQPKQELREVLTEADALCKEGRRSESLPARIRGTVERLQRSAATAGEERYLVLTALGDLSSLQVDATWQKQAGYYMDALRAKPSADIAAARLLDLCRTSKASGAELAPACRAIQASGHPLLASQAWLLVVQRAEQGSGARDDALTAYVESECDRAAFGPRSLAALAGDQSHPVAELALLLEAPSKAPIEWWRASSLRAHVIARALQALAVDRIQAESIEEGAAVLERAFAVAPEYNEYLDGQALGGKPVVRLDAALRLASLLNTPHPPEHADERFRALVERLIDGKNLAYLERNLAAMRSYHTVLGTIYAERNAWDGSMYGATYHLSRAVDIAEEQVALDPLHARPAPHLAVKLAQGLMERDRSGAAGAWLKAARGYMELGDLDAAVTALSATRKLKSAGVAAPAELDRLGALLDLQVGVRQLDLTPDKRAAMRSQLKAFEVDAAGLGKGLELQFERLREKLDHPDGGN